MDIIIGDVVGRKSYHCDVVFKVYDIVKCPDGNIILLKGINMRILADAPENDIIKLPENKIKEETEYFQKVKQECFAKLHKSGWISNLASKKVNLTRGAEQVFKMPGKILHLDGDQSYLNQCMKTYKDLGLEAVGKVVQESNQPTAVKALLEQYQPDILVLTGHDGFIKNKKDYNSLDSYRNSAYFIEAVKESRRYEVSKDELVIFAGACQSFFEGIMSAGANYASSPNRIMIHALDPAMVCQKVALTPIDKIVSLDELIKGTISGIQGIGGIQTRGKYRDGMPKPLYGKL